MKAIICGGRRFTDRNAAFVELDHFHAIQPISFVIEGGAIGGDRFGREWAIENGIPFKKYHADWENLKRKAGPIRNTQMLRDGAPDIVLAFPGDRGTAHMKQIAREADVEVVELCAED